MLDSLTIFEDFFLIAPRVLEKAFACPQFSADAYIESGMLQGTQGDYSSTEQCTQLNS